MTEAELKFRLKQFALRIIRLVDEMPHSVSSKALANQIMRSGTSPYSNYCAACIAKSEKDFLNKLKMVEEELDETCHWIELIIETEMLPKNRMEPLNDECKELLSIIIRSITSTRKHLAQQ